MDKKLWYAVNGTGQGYVFLCQPVRDEHFKVWQGEMLGCITMLVALFESEGFALPALKWSDEPILLNLSLNVV